MELNNFNQLQILRVTVMTKIICQNNSKYNLHIWIVLNLFLIHPHEENLRRKTKT